MANQSRYLLDIPDPVQSAFEGYKIGTVMKQQQQADQDRLIKQQQAKQMQQDFTQVAQKKNASAQDFSNLILKYPQLSEHIKQGFDILNTDQKTNRIKQLTELDSALQSGNTEVAKQLLTEHYQAAKNSGNKEDEVSLDAMLKTLEISPESLKFSTSAGLVSLIGADKYADYRSKTGKRSEGFDILSNEQKIQYGLDPKKSYQIGPDKKIYPIGQSGVTVNVGDKGKFGTIPPGYLLKEDENGMYMAPIPGSPQDKALEQEGKAEVVQAKSQRQSADVVLTGIDQLIDTVDNAPWYQPAAGVISSKIPLNQARKNAEASFKTIASNIAFDKLQRMRKESPTGGALGQVSDREIQFLQSTLGSPDLDQSPEQLKANLMYIRTIYDKLAAYPNAEKYGLTSNSEKSESKESNVDPLGLGI